jgi:hypothetical protein
MRKEIAELLESTGAERALNNRGVWKGEIRGWQLWIGDPAGSRSNKFEIEVMQGARYYTVRTAKFSAIVKKITDCISSHNNLHNP